MKKLRTKAKPVRDESGTIAWEELSTTEQAAFTKAFDSTPATDRRCREIYPRATGGRASIAAFLAIAEDAVRKDKGLFFDEIRFPASGDVEFQRYRLQQDFRAIANVAKTWTLEILWECIENRDSDTLEWLAEYVRKRKPPTKSLRKAAANFDLKRCDFPPLEKISGESLAAVILRRFVALSESPIQVMLSARIAHPKRVPTKAFLKEDVRREWEEAGNSPNAIDSDFSSLCAEMGLNALPRSSRNPRWLRSR